MNGTAVYGERVVVVEVESKHVHLKTGRISSTDEHGAVVRGDRKFHAVAESPDEAYEKSFHADDIHLLKEQEARSLQDPDAAENWFGSIYQDWLVAKIRRALKRLKLG